ncbi:Secondary thiamine-phosphate synthase enzyme [uncultured Desulfobacterium sp.]|uniref:Secondary thiamine-phosphate synthase enzyme n=1 Tax=uncultured Desulfobacterium sp. TaxID=201089 RepID=A0A445MR93_9BACT|nr:Secondary thiamine-phosphate synthase enzyme [uncultured Desulfobacterium sp.]
MSIATIQQHCETIEVNLATGPDIKDITEKLSACVVRSRITEGTISVFMTGSTGSLTTIEYEPGVISDLKQAISRLAPPGLSYSHEQAWHDGNGHSHVQAAVMGPSITLPVRFGRLRLGTWQQVVAINHDNRPRKRNIEVTIIGRTAAPGIV